MRGLGPDAVSFVWGLKVGFILLLYSVVCTVESLSLFYLLLILDVFVLGDDLWIS